MNESISKHRVLEKQVDKLRNPIGSLLVAVDLTPSSDRVLGRVVLLPLADGARITLFHVIPGNVPPAAQPNARKEAKKALAEEAQYLRKSLPTIHIEPILKQGNVAKEIAACAKAVKAELIVMGRVGGRILRDIFLGSTAERVIRQGRLPVLVVRLPARASYRRPAIALDHDAAAREILNMMLRVIEAPRPRIKVIHAFEAPYLGPVYPNYTKDQAEELKADFQLEATQRLSKLLTTGPTRAKAPPGDMPRWQLHVRYGSPRIVIETAVRKSETDLLVLGTHGYPSVVLMFIGTVSGDVLRHVACDVLVVPPRQTKRK